MILQWKRQDRLPDPVLDELPVKRPAASLQPRVVVDQRLQPYLQETETGVLGWKHLLSPNADEQPRRDAAHGLDGLDVDLRVVAVVDLHARCRRAVAAGEACREEGAALAEDVPVHAHPDGDPLLPVQHHRQVAGLRPPELDADLVLRLLLPTRRRRRLGGRLVLPPRLVGGCRWLVGHGRRGLD